MTPRDVLDRLTPDQRTELASICIEYLDPATLHSILLEKFTEDDRLELGLRIKQSVPQ